MSGFNFEKNLPHQEAAVKAVSDAFVGVKKEYAKGIERNIANPVLSMNGRYVENIKSIQKANSIDKFPNKDCIIDIMMETGTGKTYTYTKTIFELNKLYELFKFVIVVPTLSIKAGTVDFLKSESCRNHFKEQYGKTINLYIVESMKGTKGKKSYFPQAVNDFVSSESFEKDKIQVLLINAGMINSDTMSKRFEKLLHDKYDIPFDGIAAVNPFLIIDEPHKFAKSNTTWANIEKMKPRFILRYGATFPEKEVKKGKEKIKVKDYHNLVYTLSAVDSFNQNLVKGVIAHVTEFGEGKNYKVEFTNTDGNEATFKYSEEGKSKSFKISPKESLSKINPAMSSLCVEKLNKNVAVLSNGLELKKGDIINPYSYHQTLQETMIEKAVKNHFDLERQLLKRDVRIKPLTLFFIDNIDEYRKEEGYIKTTVEKHIKAQAEEILKTEENEFYKDYLKKTLESLPKTHGGYFSKDNSEKDEEIEKEVNEILHDKQTMLSLDNPRRFIFSKWTLREGWDNPNVFQICKLRGSGSEISKLQEVGRGLRLPVNEYGSRVKEENFYLNYFVDFTEESFVDKLVSEINMKSNAISIDDKLDNLDCKGLLDKICDKYNLDKIKFLEEMDAKKFINRANEFQNGGYEYIKENYPLVFDGVNSNKVRKAGDEKRKISTRIGKYSALKELWEKLNEKVILEYKIDKENDFKNFFVCFLNSIKNNFSENIIRERKFTVEVSDSEAAYSESISIASSEEIGISSMKYSNFLEHLSKDLYINKKTLHDCFLESEIAINKYLSMSTVRAIKDSFNNYLMYNSIDKFGIEYQKVSACIHPTKLTNKNGTPVNEINASDIGILYSDKKAPKKYYFEEIFYDSDLERKNILEGTVEEIEVFTKIPKNSIKIPIAGGKSYSPDFAYVINYKNGEKKLYFIVETKNVDKEENLRREEEIKIKHAEKFFDNKLKIKFCTQFKEKSIVDLITDICRENN